MNFRSNLMFFDGFSINFHNFGVYSIKFETLLMLKLQESQRLKAYHTDEMVEESAGCTLCIGLYPQSEDHIACTNF